MKDLIQKSLPSFMVLLVGFSLFYLFALGTDGVYISKTEHQRLLEIEHEHDNYYRKYHLYDVFARYETCKGGVYGGFVDVSESQCMDGLVTSSTQKLQTVFTSTFQNLILK